MTEKTDEPRVKFQRAYTVTVQDGKGKKWHTFDVPFGETWAARRLTHQDVVEIEMMLHGALNRWRIDHSEDCVFNADGTPKRELA